MTIGSQLRAPEASHLETVWAAVCTLLRWLNDKVVLKLSCNELGSWSSLSEELLNPVHSGSLTDAVLDQADVELHQWQNLIVVWVSVICEDHLEVGDADRGEASLLFDILLDLALV